ncbi:MAG: hypothetical protein HOL37_07265 [Rhodospirillaceae bacterium]|jgi:uncharacterized membrane protein|nr:hypothetical protein [Rhodospirillaceae bacterium]MBT4219638.1 hypothetical protein [Rhodospirillaceae bacterium]MBT5014591.1 hypothetical protein [Rhodospirillaceae bacterium]MBT5309116.1 hypothetical protein [Rhodospirillaceae bacterium]MBT7355357.1 hypothetical protein [Rhodospirillaceae bacterium]
MSVWFGGFGELILAMVVFIASHMIPSHRPLRRALVGMVGEWPFMGLYSVLSVGLLWWLIVVYQHSPDVVLFEPITFFRHLPLALMLPVCLLVVGAFRRRDGGIVPGVLKITRHPVLWALAIWAVMHMAANPYGAAWILFGSMAALAVFGSIHMDRRQQTDGDARDLALVAETSNVPLAALIAGRARLQWDEIGWPTTIGTVVVYGVLLWAHKAVIGISPLPLP